MNAHRSTRRHLLDAAEALRRLKDGNQRFANGKTRHAHESANWRKQLVGGQRPFATILGCSDSRAPIELVFDQGFGDLFVVRVAGNVIAPDVIGSLGYAVAHLATPLVVVMGHQGCGAVTAAVEALKAPTNELPGIKALLELIEPGLPKTLPGDTPEQQINAAVEANVRWSIKQLARLPQAERVLAAKQVSLVGAVYELATGRVRFLSD
jgi:carbonic anhydrase